MACSFERPNIIPNGIYTSYTFKIMYFQLGYIVILTGQKGLTVANRLYVTCLSTCMYIHADNNLHSTKS